MEPTEQDYADLEYWREFAAEFGFKLLGFTFRNSASIVTRVGWTPMEVRGFERDAIMERIQALKKED